MVDVAAAATGVRRRSRDAVRRVRESSLFLPATIAVAGALAYWALIALDKAVAGSHTPIELVVALALLGTAAAAAIWNRDLRYSEIWTPLHILMRGAGAAVFVQICFDALYPAAVTSNIFMGIDPLMRTLAGFAFLSGIAAMARPAFLLPMGLAYIQFRFGVPKIFGLPETSLDFQTINDVGTFSAMSVLAWRTVATHSAGIPQKLRAAIADPQTRAVFEQVLWAICVGVHLGNYFHSGLAKLELGLPDPLFWIKTNPTAQSIAIGLDRFVAPLAGWPHLLQLYHDFLTRFVIPFNIAVFFIQLFAPLAITRRRLLIAATLFFDAMHIGIFLSLGPLFFFWIALNVVILLSLEAMEDRDLTPALKFTVVLAALFGQITFATAKLGWLDGKKVVREVFYANTDDGRRVLVPPATFGLFAYQIAHGDLFIPDNHFKMRSGGNADRTDWADASTCGPAIVKHQDYVGSVNRMRDMVVQTDAYFRRHPWVRDLRLYYFYPNHAFSNPVFFRDYMATPLERIRSYSYVVESECVGVKDGRLDSSVKVRSEYRFDIDRT